MPRTRRMVATGLIALASASCERHAAPSAEAPFELIASWPHDAAAYTQGLVWADSVFYESTGRYGESQLRRVDARSGHVLAARSLASAQFGEGLALLGERLYQLTWKSEVGYVYDAKTLAPVDSFTYAGEGWGLATDGTSLIMSDGSDSLRFLSPKTFKVERVVHVRDKGSPLKLLNELEYVNGDLYANVYESDWIARIDPVSGDVRALLDFAELYPRDDRPQGTEVMNGIATDGKGRFFLTGKLWPKLFEVRLRTRATTP